MPANHPAEEPGSPYSPTSDVESLPEVQADPEISLYPLQRLDEENARVGIISHYVNAELPTPQDPIITPPELPAPPYPIPMDAADPDIRRVQFREESNIITGNRVPDQPSQEEMGMDPFSQANHPHTRPFQELSDFIDASIGEPRQNRPLPRTAPPLPSISHLAIRRRRRPPRGHFYVSTVIDSLRQNLIFPFPGTTELLPSNTTSQNTKFCVSCQSIPSVPLEVHNSLGVFANNHPMSYLANDYK